MPITSKKNLGPHAVKALFEQAAGKPYDGNEALWADVLAAIKLPLCYLIAAQTALGQHRWRNAQNPAGYVKTATMREGLHSGTTIPDDYSEPVRDRTGRCASVQLTSEQQTTLTECFLSIMRCKDHPEYDGTGERPWYHCGRCDDIYSTLERQAQAVTTLTNQRTKSLKAIPLSNARMEHTTGTKRSAESMMDALEFNSCSYDAPEERIPHRNELSKAGLVTFNPLHEDGYEIAWDHVAAEAQLDKGEARILQLRFQRGYSRDSIVAMCKTEKQQKQALADFKRLDRKMDRVHAVFKRAAGIGPLNPPTLTRTSKGSHTGTASKTAVFLPPWDAIKVARERHMHHPPRHAKMSASLFLASLGSSPGGTV